MPTVIVAGTLSTHPGPLPFAGTFVDATGYRAMKTVTSRNVIELTASFPALAEGAFQKGRLQT